MKVLLIKLTSMGDLIHALPAITDASQNISDITFDWVIEKSFSEVAVWHPAVKKVIPTSHRKWKKSFFHSWKNGEIVQFLMDLRKTQYDVVIDGQTNIKSAFACLLAKGNKHGLDKNSAREWLAPFAYHHKYFISKEMHAIKRLRILFSKALNYEFVDSKVDYGISRYSFPPLKMAFPKPYLVFVHNASWQSKLWPVNHWRSLIQMAEAEGHHIVLPWGNDKERQIAEKIANGFNKTVVLPFCTLSEQAEILKQSAGAICSDTGLSHLAAALNVPAITLYGSTSTQLIGTTGQYQQHIISNFPCTKCYKHNCYYENKPHADALCLTNITPASVWKHFQAVR